MQLEYNWKAILTGAIPVSIIMALIFYFNLRGKWIYLIVALLVSIVITYFMDNKKQNIFTSPVIVILITIIVNGLRNLGFI